MPRPTGQQFIQLYRGLAGVSPETLDKGRLGRHWSSNQWVAESFGTDGLGDDEPSMVIGALVHKRHIIPEGTEEWDEEAGRYDAYGEDSPESEYTVRPGAPVHITGITHYPDANREENTWRSDLPLSELRKYRA